MSNELEPVPADVPERVSRFMGTVLGSVAIEVDAMLGEQVRAWRFKRQIRIMQKAQEQLEAAGLEAEPVPFRTLAPLLEGGSFEEDQELVERWSSLLAQAAAAPSTVPASFPLVLRELEPLDSRVLFMVFDNIMRFAPDLRPHIGTTRASLADDLRVSEDIVRFHCENLVRLGLLTTVASASGTADYTRRLSLTVFGQRFVRACRPAGAADPPVVVTEPPRGLVSFDENGAVIEHLPTPEEA